MPPIHPGRLLIDRRARETASPNSLRRWQNRFAHADEAALRRFAHESSYITDRTTLLERTKREVKEHTSAGEVAVLVRDGSASYASASNGERVTVSENDPGILALRAWHKAGDHR